MDDAAATDSRPGTARELQLRPCETVGDAAGVGEAGLRDQGGGRHERRLLCARGDDDAGAGARREMVIRIPRAAADSQGRAGVTETAGLRRSTSSSRPGNGGDGGSWRCWRGTEGAGRGAGAAACACELGPVFIGRGTMNVDGNGARFIASMADGVTDRGNGGTSI